MPKKALEALLTVDKDGEVTAVKSTADIKSALSKLVADTTSGVKGDTVLIPESTQGAGDGVTVQDVIDDKTPAAGSAATKVKDALDKAFEAAKPGDSTTPADTKLDEALAASGLTTEQQAAVKEYSSVDSTGKVTVNATKFSEAKTTNAAAPVANLSSAKDAVGLATQYAEAVSAEPTGALTEGLFRDSVPADSVVAGALRLNNVAVLGKTKAAETTLYFTKKDVPLSGVAKKITRDCNE